MSKYIVELEGITKRFPGVVALDDMSFKLEKNKIHGLIGENGSGKSTIIKILTGVLHADEGKIWFDGSQVDSKKQRNIKKSGISCVFQDINIVKSLSITDNIFINNGIYKKGTRLLDYKKMNKKASELLHLLGVDVDVTKPCSDYGLGILQMVEIAKVILNEAKLVIFDEPTTCLGKNETTVFLNVVRELKKRGITILYVSHKLEEMLDICDTITGIRDGKYICTESAEKLEKEKLISLMIGYSSKKEFPIVHKSNGREAIRLNKVSVNEILYDISFCARYGEVVGICGTLGSGRSAICKTIFGLLKKNSGEIYINGNKVHIKSAHDAIKHKIAFLTEDRKNDGFIMNESIKNNLILASMKSFTKKFYLDTKKIQTQSEEVEKKLKIKCASLGTPVVTLSGGNQQKVVIGKWINTCADIYIFDEPTKGIDIAGKSEIYKIIAQLAASGKCIILISSEIPELIGLAQRILVMNDGHIIQEIDSDSTMFNQECVTDAMYK